MIELYHWEPNGFYLKPLIALKEKGVAFNSHYVDPTDLSQPAAPHLNLETEHNTEISGPILVDNGESIVESFFMLEYIDEAYPQEPKLLPGDPVGNWNVRVWGRILGERTAPSFATLGCLKYLVPKIKDRQVNVPADALDQMPSKELRDAWAPVLKGSYPQEEVEDSRRKAGEAVKRVEDALANGDWLLGSNYSLVDIEAFALMNAMPKLLPEACSESASPRTMAWLRRMRARPAVQEALAMARTSAPDEAFAPGPEHPRWG